MLTRLQHALTSDASRERFEAEGFGWRFGTTVAP